MTEPDDLPDDLKLIDELHREWDRRFPGNDNSPTFFTDGTLRFEGYLGEDELRWLLEAVGRIRAGASEPPLVIGAPACGVMVYGSSGHGEPCALRAGHAGKHKWGGGD